VIDAADTGARSGSDVLHGRAGDAVAEKARQRGVEDRLSLRLRSGSRCPMCGGNGLG
jgi:hypothetical protein